MAYPTVSDIIAEREQLRTVLAASQAREAALRDDVGRCYQMLLSEPDTQGALFKAENILREALAMPQDDTALREMIEAEREACAAECERKHVNGNWMHDTRDECAEAIRARKG